MEMAELTRLITGLRASGWTEKRINDFLLWIGWGEERYLPQQGPAKQTVAAQAV